jgi:hypothetical protein
VRGTSWNRSSALVGIAADAFRLTVRGETLVKLLRDDRIGFALDHLVGGRPRNIRTSHGLASGAPAQSKQECAMKLTSAQVERTLRQFEAQAIPDDHPVVPQLIRLFGEHTFFLDSHGLNIIEPAGTAPADPEAQRAKIVNVANWSEGNETKLEPHEPEPTDVVVTLGSKH